MVFKSLVDAIIKYQRNPDDILALNTVTTLKRELRNDLIQAYDVSQPLIHKHTQTFHESRSFLDFLIKIHQLPIMPEYPIEDSVITLLKKQLDQCQKEKESLQKLLDECFNTERTLSNTSIDELNKIISTLKQKLELCKHEKRTLEVLFEECKKQNESLNGENTRLKNNKSFDNRNEFSTDFESFKAHYESMNQQLKLQVSTLEENLKICSIENETLKSNWQRHENEYLTKINNLNDELSQYKSNMQLKKLRKITYDGDLVTEFSQITQCPNYALDHSQRDPDDEFMVDESQRAITDILNEPLYLENAAQPLCLENANYSNPLEILTEKNKTLEREKADLLNKVKSANEEKQTFEEDFKKCKIDLEKYSEESKLKDESIKTIEKSLELKTTLANEFRRELEKCNKKLKDNILTGNKTITYLQNYYKGRGEEWEDLFIAEWENSNALLEKAREQCKKIEMGGDRIKVTLENFGDHVLGLLSNLTKNSTMIEQIAEETGFVIDDQLSFRIKMKMNELEDYRNTIEKIGFTEISFSDEILKIWDSLKTYARLLNPKLTIDDSNEWIFSFLKWLQEFTFTNAALKKKAESLENILLEFSKLPPNINFENKIEWKNNFIEYYKRLYNESNYLKQISELTPDIPYENGWNKSFIKRYKGLWKFAIHFTNSEQFVNLIPEKNLIIDDCMDSFVSSLDIFQTNLQEMANYLAIDTLNESQWMKKCIEKMIDIIKNSNLQGENEITDLELLEETSIADDTEMVDEESAALQSTTAKQNLSSKTLYQTKTLHKQFSKVLPTKRKMYELYKQCVKLAKYFKIEKDLDTRTFYEDIIHSPLFENYNEMGINNKQWLPFYNNFKLYFNVQNIPTENIAKIIETTFQMILNELNVSSLNLNIEGKSTFQTHLYAYSKWIVDQFISKCDTQAQNILSHYKNWLLQLNLDPNLSPEKFSEYLAEYMRKQRKSKLPFDFESSETSAKKLALEENWSNIEIQNIIYTLYKSFFTLKFNILQKNNPLLEDNNNHVQEKLKIIERINQNTRQNELLNAFTQYVKFDLQIFIEGNIEKIFRNIQQKDALLETCMQRTEKFLATLIAAKTTSMDEES